VDVEVRQADRGAEIVVRDTGEGITPEFLPHVFERFRQSDSRPSRRHGGLGLGLAIVRHLTEAHGGTVHATSEGVGRGAVFIVRLPTESVGPRQPPTPAGPGVEAPVLARRHILIVDDEADARDLTYLILTGRGAEVTAVGSAGEALHLLRTQHFDALVADIGMSDQDGHALIRAVRALQPDESGNIPAVAVTAYASLHDRDEALGAGYDWHVPKPAEPNELVDAIANVISVRRTPPQSAAPDGAKP
jgi:CheY-like chemotaxis protein